MTQPQYFPPRDQQRAALNAPVTSVTVLEDRAQVQRSITVSLDEGTHKLFVADVAPVMQDVSLRAESSTGEGDARGRISDISIRRAMRIERKYKEKLWAESEEQLESLQRQFEDAKAAQHRANQRHSKVTRMLLLGNTEVSQDVAWGTHDLQQWQETFEQLFDQTHQLRDEALTAYYEQEDIQRAVEREISRLSQMATPDKHFSAWIELDVVMTQSAEITIDIFYTCPNAMWRPQHRATLNKDGSVRFETQAVVWQNTGETWADVHLTCSTAKSSLGVEPPLLHDDFLTAQRRNENVVIQAREVDIQTTGPIGGGGAGGEVDTSINLPGVDDGGQTRNISPEDTVLIDSSGDPHVVPLYHFESQSDRTFLAMPELTSRVFLRCVIANTSSYPLLAGPVELVRNSGTVGWTETLYVAPDAHFELSFGPQDEFTIQRDVLVLSDKQDPISKWHNKKTSVTLYLSNLGDAAQELRIEERVPVSEIEHVRVEIDDERTSPAVSANDHGICVWTITLDGHSNRTLTLTWTLSQSPEVTNLLQL